MKSPKGPQDQSPSTGQNAKPGFEKPKNKPDHLQPVMEKFPKPNTFPKNWDLSNYMKG